jgi:tetratricopeptide (TPR) repeat protein
MGYAGFGMIRALALSWCLVLAGGLGFFDAAAHAQLSTEDLLNASDAERRELEARQYFELGRLAFIDGRFEEALQAFERSYELSQRALLLFNIGSAHDRLRHEREALQAFERYLEAEPDAENRGEVEGRIAFLRRSIARADELERQRLEAEAEVERARLEDEEEGVAETWWFWTIIGAAVAGVGVTLFFLLRTSLEAPLEGNTSPGVSEALRW